jgi:hypothetical protein
MPIAGRTETRESVGPIEPTRQGKSAARTGAVISILVGLFLLFDSVTKLLRLPPVVAATVQLGFPAGTVPVIGGLLLFSLALYVVPRPSYLGDRRDPHHRIPRRRRVHQPSRRSCPIHLHPGAGLHRRAGLAGAVPAQPSSAGPGARRTLRPISWVDPESIHSTATPTPSHPPSAQPPPSTC